MIPTHDNCIIEIYPDLFFVTAGVPSRNFPRHLFIKHENIFSNKGETLYDVADVPEVPPSTALLTLFKKRGHLIIIVMLHTAAKSNDDNKTLQNLMPTS